MLSTLQSKKETTQLFFEFVEQNETSQLIDLVLSTHRDPRCIRNDQQQTLLHAACQANHGGIIDMVRVLVEIYQCNPMLTDRNSLTAYDYACSSGNLEVFTYLFRVSDHNFASDYQPPPNIVYNVFHQFYMLVLAASQSGSIEMLRYLYSFHHHGKVSCLKPILFKDKLCTVCKVVDCPHLSTV